MDLRAFLRHVGVLFDPLDPLEDMVRTTEPQSIQGSHEKGESERAKQIRRCLFSFYPQNVGPISPSRQGITAATSMKELEAYKEARCI